MKVTLIFQKIKINWVSCISVSGIFLARHKYFHGSIDPFGFNPFPKNPNIRKFFTAFGWTDEIGSGIRNTHKYLPLYVPDAKPVFIEDETFKTIIPLRTITLSAYKEQLGLWLGLSEKAQAHFARCLLSITLPGFLADAAWDKVLASLVQSWNKKGTQLEALNWPVKPPLPVDSLQKVPTPDEKGTQLLKKKYRYYISILILLSEPAKLKDLMEWLDYKNQQTFRGNYIHPLLESGLIELTIPDKPTHPDNKYKTTVTGIHFISGVDYLNGR